MFRKDLKRRLEAIFGLHKTTFLKASDMYEQDTMFIEITASRSGVSGAKGGRETARVVGNLIVFSQDNKLAYGFFSKKIEQADPELTRPFFFYDVDTDDNDSSARTQDLHERSTSFVFLYDSQYDPDKGELTSLTLSGEGL